VSRNAFRRSGKKSTSHQMMWLMFLYRNARQCQQLARRRSDRWAAFKDPERGELKHKAHDHPAGDSRYVAVNCRNDRTYELRFFQSTLDEQEMRAALEFADATVEYTRGLKAHDVLKGNALSWNKFASYVRTHHYPNLEAEIRKNPRLRPQSWRVPANELPIVVPVEPTVVERVTRDDQPALRLSDGTIRCDCVHCHDSASPLIYRD